MKRFLPLVVASCMLCSVRLMALDVPVLQGRVNDYADMISPGTESQLEAELEAFEKSDSTQVVILTVLSLEGEVLEEYVLRVAEAWRIGRAKRDNGVIFFAAKNDRVMRIEVGRGLEGVLTDLLAGRILDNIVRPRFREGNFDGGFIDGTGAVLKACRGEFTNDSLPADDNKNGQPLSSVIVYLIFGFIVIASLMRKISKAACAVSGAVMLPVIVHLALFPLAMAGVLITAVIGALFGMVSPRIAPGSYSDGSGWSVFTSGDGSSDGGFSGGGGSFGGGGASGGW